MTTGFSQTGLCTASTRQVLTTKCTQNTSCTDIDTVVTYFSREILTKMDFMSGVTLILYTSVLICQHKQVTSTVIYIASWLYLSWNNGAAFWNNFVQSKSILQYIRCCILFFISNNIKRSYKKVTLFFYRFLVKEFILFKLMWLVKHWILYVVFQAKLCQILSLCGLVTLVTLQNKMQHRRFVKMFFLFIMAHSVWF